MEKLKAFKPEKPKDIEAANNNETTEALEANLRNIFDQLPVDESGSRSFSSTEQSEVVDKIKAEYLRRLATDATRREKIKHTTLQAKPKTFESWLHEAVLQLEADALAKSKADGLNLAA